MSKNLISMSALCVDNPINVLFFLLFLSGAGSSHGGLVHEQRKDGVYYLLKAIPLWSSTLALSSSVRSSFFAISIWHSRLGHPSLHIFCKFLSVLNISFPEDHLCSFSCTSYNINKSHKLPFAKSSITFFSPQDIIFSDVWTLPVSSADGFNYYLFLLTITPSIFGFNRYVKNRIFIPPLLPSINLLKTISPPPLKHFTQIMGANF